MSSQLSFNLAVIMQFYSGLNQIIKTNEWSHSGSPAYFNFIQGLELSKDFNYQLILLSTFKDNKKIQYLKLNNLEKVVVIVPYYPLLMSYRFRFIKKIENFYNKVRQYFAVIRLTKTVKYYYIDRDNILFSYFVLRFRNAKVVVRLLGVTENLYEHLTIRNNIFSKVIKWVFNHPDVNIICTNDGSYAEATKNQYKNKFHLLFNGVDTNLKRNLQLGKRLKVVYLSRIVGNKGHEDFINGIAKSNLINKLDVKIIGDGGLKNNMEAISSNLHLDECINFMGRLSHHEAIDELSRADLVISINYDGVYGNVVLEASQMSIPVIVLEHPECRSGSLYNLLELKRDIRLADGIAKLLRKAVNDRVWLGDLGKRSEQFSSKYLSSWNQRIELEMLIIKRFFSN